MCFGKDDVGQCSLMRQLLADEQMTSLELVASTRESSRRTFDAKDRRTRLVHKTRMWLYSWATSKCSVGMSSWPVA